jgi:NAD(P)-dependent dehydrogenase (short-subunit alcohol dehydrogenase family)
VVHYGRSTEEADQTAAEIRALGRQAWTVSANLTNQSEVNALVPFVINRAGRLDILINSASIFPPEDFLSATADSWDKNMSINLKAPFRLSQDFAKHLPANRPGKIINLLDATAMRPRNQSFSYTISKFGLQGLTLATAHALAPRNVQVNGIALGAILPNINDDPAKFEKLAETIPAERTGSPDDVVKAMLYLLKDGDYVTGEIIRVDGGKHLA